MKELTASQVRINDAFWSPRLDVNAKSAIFHQWKQLEDTRCIDNFHIATGEKDGFREGWFFADSDAYKWLDAASRIYALQPDPKLASLMDDFISLIARTQQSDGYIFTYNQIHFPNQRWVNLQVEHELYCHGHLIEAGVSHYYATGSMNMLDICVKAADLLVRDFLNTSAEKTCGHEEIEIALIRLYRVTRNEEYLELARQFVERRGRIRFFPVHILRQFSSFNKRAILSNISAKNISSSILNTSPSTCQGTTTLPSRASAVRVGISTPCVDSMPSSISRSVNRRYLSVTL